MIPYFASFVNKGLKDFSKKGAKGIDIPLLRCYNILAE